MPHLDNLSSQLLVLVDGCLVLLLGEDWGVVVGVDDVDGDLGHGGKLLLANLTSNDLQNTFFAMMTDCGGLWQTYKDSSRKLAKIDK